MLRKTAIILILLGLVINHCLAQPSGVYTGNIKVMGQTIDIEVSLTRENDGFSGHLSIPAQGASNLRLNSIRHDAPSFTFRVDTATTRLEFEGRYYPDGDSLSGIFRQSGFEGTYFLTSENQKEETVDWIRREVFFHNDTIKLAGTLSLPDTNQLYPAVMLISGSGQQDRDENVMGFKIFRQLEQYFISRDIAVLRYDDRGAGASDQGNVEQATSKDFADDALAGLRYLKNHPFIHPDKAGMLGHSEGSIIANMVANRTDAAFVVMMAGPVMPGSELLPLQGKTIMQAEGMDEEKIRKNVETNQSIYQEVMKENPDWGHIRELFRGALQQLDSAKREQTINQQMPFLKSPWMKFFLKYDPAGAIAKSDYPVLAIFGGKDTQVPAEQNVSELKQVIGNNQLKNVEIITFDQANHLFQKADTGSPGEYSKLKKSFVEGFTEKVADWILMQVE